jgi:hypothetical protein
MLLLASNVTPSLFDYAKEKQSLKNFSGQFWAFCHEA